MMITNHNPIATEKLQKNVAEFIIYIYQMEDLCRVYEFKIDDISEFVIRHFPVDDEGRKEMKTWFELLITEMSSQQIRETGHLNQVQEYVEKLIELKYRLLEEDEEFARVYDTARPHIREIIAESGNSVPNDIQACLNGIYGLLLARMNGREVPEELNTALNSFGNVLSYLSYKYKQENFIGSN